MRCASWRCVESHSGNDTAALEMLAEARSLAGQAGAFRPLLHVAINESHVLEGMGEHERAAQVARGRHRQRAGLRARPLDRDASWRSTWPSRWSRSAGGTRPSRSSSMPWRFPRRSCNRPCCGCWPVISRCAAATWPTRGRWPPPPARRSAGPGSGAITRASTTCRWPGWRPSCASPKAGRPMRVDVVADAARPLRPASASPGTPGRCSPPAPGSAPRHLPLPPGTGLAADRAARPARAAAHRWRGSWTPQARSSEATG